MSKVSKLINLLKLFKSVLEKRLWDKSNSFNFLGLILDNNELTLVNELFEKYNFSSCEQLLKFKSVNWLSEQSKYFKLTKSERSNFPVNNSQPTSFMPTRLNSFTSFLFSLGYFLSRYS